MTKYLDFIEMTLKGPSDGGLSGAFTLSQLIQTCVQLLRSLGTYVACDCQTILIGLSLDIQSRSRST